MALVVVRVLRWPETTVLHSWGFPYHGMRALSIAHLIKDDKGYRAGPHGR